MDFESFDDLEPKEVNLKLGFYAKKKIEESFWDLQKICMTVNVHLEKKHKITPKKIIEDSRMQNKIKNLTPEEKAEMMSGLVSNKNNTQDFLDKKKAEATIKELRRQGKLK